MTAFWRWTPRPASSNGITSPRRTTMGLGRDRDARADRRQLAGAAAQTAGPGQSQRFLLCARPDQRQLLLAKQFVKELTWATGIGADGEPIKVPGQEPSETGTRVCPSQDGATNWYSPSYNPATGLFYMQTNEKCSVYHEASG